ncbi:hypothetical protein AB1Y20_022082 [Prymnesium parvum]|uniref:Uncharacterized protein n=1 Tax=Prymnesium parvum TaxID=97485 RepID=A0AB34JG73_PRYPA
MGQPPPRLPLLLISAHAQGFAPLRMLRATPRAFLRARTVDAAGAPLSAWVRWRAAAMREPPPDAKAELLLVWNVARVLEVAQGAAWPAHALVELELRLQSGAEELLGVGRVAIGALEGGETVDVALAAVPMAGLVPTLASKWDAEHTVRIRALRPHVRRKRLFLVRHGESFWNSAQSRMDVVPLLTQIDHPLTLTGYHQAAVLAAALRTAQRHYFAQPRLVRQLLDAEAVWSSPLTRALQTAIVGAAPLLSPRGCCAPPPKPLHLRVNAREHQKLGAADCVGVAMGAECVLRAISELRLLGEKAAEGTPLPFDAERLAAEAAQVVAPAVDHLEAERRWWEHSSETEQMVGERIDALLEQVRHSAEASIVLVGHSYFFRQLLRAQLHPSFAQRFPERARALTEGKLAHCAIACCELDFDADAHVVVEATVLRAVFDETEHRHSHFSSPDLAVAPLTFRRGASAVAPPPPPPPPPPLHLSMALALLLCTPRQIRLRSSRLLLPSSDLPSTAAGRTTGRSAALLRAGEWLALGDPSAPAGGAVWLSDRRTAAALPLSLPLADGAAFGASLAALPDVFAAPPPGGATLAVGAVESAATGSGAVYVVQLRADLSVARWRRLAAVDASLQPGDGFGHAIAAMADGAVAVAAAGTRRVDGYTGALVRGSVFLLRLDADANVTSCTRLEALRGGVPPLAGLFGGALAELRGMAWGGGVTALAVGVTTSALAYGGVLVLSLRPNGTVAAVASIEAAALEGHSPALGDLFGYCSVAALPDLDWDGRQELLVGACREDSAGTNAGAAYVLYLGEGCGLKSYVRLHLADFLPDVQVVAPCVRGRGEGVTGEESSPELSELRGRRWGWEGEERQERRSQSCRRGGACVELEGAAGALLGESVATLPSSDVSPEGLHTMAIGVPNYRSQGDLNVGGILLVEYQRPPAPPPSAPPPPVPPPPHAPPSSPPPIVPAPSFPPHTPANAPDAPPPPPRHPPPSPPHPSLPPDPSPPPPPLSPPPTSPPPPRWPPPPASPHASPSPPPPAPPLSLLRNGTTWRLRAAEASLNEAGRWDVYAVRMYTSIACDSPSAIATEPLVAANPHLASASAIFCPTSGLCELLQLNRPAYAFGGAPSPPPHECAVRPHLPAASPAIASGAPGGELGTALTAAFRGAPPPGCATGECDVWLQIVLPTRHVVGCVQLYQAGTAFAAAVSVEVEDAATAGGWLSLKTSDAARCPSTNPLDCCDLSWLCDEVATIRLTPDPPPPSLPPRSPPPRSPPPKLPLDPPWPPPRSPLVPPALPSETIPGAPPGQPTPPLPELPPAATSPPAPPSPPRLPPLPPNSLPYPLTSSPLAPLQPSQPPVKQPQSPSTRAPLPPHLPPDRPPPLRAPPPAIPLASARPPHHPPLLPGRSSRTLLQVHLALLLEGSLEQFGLLERAAITRAVASAAAVASDLVTSSVRASSVWFEAVLPATNLTDQAAVFAALKTVLPNASAATAYLNLYLPGAVVIDDPVLSLATNLLVLPAPSPPPSPPLFVFYWPPPSSPALLTPSSPRLPDLGTATGDRESAQASVGLVLGVAMAAVGVCSLCACAASRWRARMKVSHRSNGRSHQKAAPPRTSGTADLASCSIDPSTMHIPPALLPPPQQQQQPHFDSRRGSAAIPRGNEDGSNGSSSNLQAYGVQHDEASGRWLASIDSFRRSLAILPRQFTPRTSGAKRMERVRADAAAQLGRPKNTFRLDIRRVAHDQSTQGTLASPVLSDKGSPRQHHVVRI